MSSLDDTLNYLDTTSRVSCPQITCEQAAEIAALLREYSEDNSQLRDDYNDLIDFVDEQRDVACGFAFDAGLQIIHLEDGLNCGQPGPSGSLRCACWATPCREHHHRYYGELAQQAACGFAWDCGREMAGLQVRHELNAERIKQEACGYAWDLGEIQAHEVLISKKYSLVATGNLDAGIYEGTGKGFTK